MADPFEVRLRFTSLLTHLTASQTSSVKTAAYALKHRDMDEDLHSCILESLDATTNPSATMNSRANIMYFLEHFCDMAIKEAHMAYVEMVQRDMRRIVAAVVHDGGGGKGVSGANIKVARKVVGELGPSGKGLLDGEVVRGIEEDLKRWEVERARMVGEEGDSGEQDIEDVKSKSEKERRHGDHSNKHTPRTKDGRSNGVNRVDKRAIEQRIEEDRERNKRLRESVWAVSGDDDEELNKLWEETSDLNEDDYAIGREEAEERRQFARYYKSLLQEAKA
ncbi:hypothetical protein H2198_007123 [Neophaeococcomyces mojaviensis]|uniref:Uncharacterized protein n=1 Tax=Neophaeococcomyces mojaviensis TaxID=3383035 RepID=A0ACC3A0U4_9EURO|nr:hypothetical protein H2198_007123 [Knufia sp. JES_112]